MLMIHIFHGFGVYYYVFGVCPRVWCGPQTPRSESSNYSSKGQDQHKGIIHCLEIKIRIKQLWIAGLVSNSSTR